MWNRLVFLMALMGGVSSCSPGLLVDDFLESGDRVCSGFEADSFVYSSFRPLSNNNDDLPSLASNIWRYHSSTGLNEPLTSFTGPGITAGNPTYGANGSKIYFHSDAPIDAFSGADIGGFNVWEMNPDGSNQRPITRNTGTESYSYSISTDGDFVVFISKQNLDGIEDGPPSLSKNLWIYQISTRRMSPLTEFTEEGVHAYAPTIIENKIVYHSTFNPTGEGPISRNVWITDLEGSSHVKLTPRDDVDSFSATLHRSGKIAFLSKLNPDDPVDGPGGSTSNLWVMDMDGSNMIPLTRNVAPNLHSDKPAFSRDGSYLTFTSYQDITGVVDGQRPGSRNIWLARTDGSGSFPLTRNVQPALGSDVSAFSPNDDYLIVMSAMALTGLDNGEPANSINLWRIDLGTGDREKVVFYEKANGNSKFSRLHTHTMFGLSSGCF